MEKAYSLLNMHKSKSKERNKVAGMILVVTGATMWGISGNVAQYLFHVHEFQSGWLTSVRMLVAGWLLVAIHFLKEGSRIWNIWRDKQARISLMIFGAVGMIGCQYAYFAAVEAGNAASATLLQYLAPVFLMLFFAVRWRRKPTAAETMAVLMAMAGVFLLVTKGHPGQVTINAHALFWGILAGIGAAIYSAQPTRLIRTWGSGIVTGWGMVIGGVIMSFFFPPWTFSGQVSFSSMAALAFVVIVGTLISFYFYLASLNYLLPVEASLLGCAEPLSASIVSVVWMDVPFGPTDWIGTACIVGTVIVLSLSSGRHERAIHVEFRRFPGK